LETRTRTGAESVLEFPENDAPPGSSQLAARR